VEDTGTVITPPEAMAVQDGGQRNWRNLTGLIVAIGAVVIVGVVVLVLVLTSGSRDPFATGPGTATITWTSVGGTNNPPQPFGGNIDGLPISGVTTVNPSAFTAPPGFTPGKPFTIHLFDIRGSFDGKGFVLGLYVRYNGLLITSQTTFPKVQVLGTYGSERVRATLTPPAADLSHPESLPPSTPILFSGTIGKLKASGRVMQPTIKNGKNNTVKATFTVS
jgi:hypothetical protein